MFNKLKPKSEFAKNVLTLMTGSTIAQAIPIAISPILTRIYTPDDFGVFALFLAITSIFGVIANGRYELAIMLPEKDEDAINIVALGLIITSILSVTILLFIFFFHDLLISFIGNEKISFWLYFIPVSVFFMGLFNVLNYFNTRVKNYKDIANATILKSVILAVVQVFAGLFKPTAGGLISGQILSNLFANMKLFNNTIANKSLIKEINMVNIKKLARRYSDFPKYSMWATLANTSALQLINILISSVYSIATLGYYSLVQKLLIMPTYLIGSSIGQVFFQKATVEKNETGGVQKTFDATLKKITMIAMPIFLVLFFIVEDVFSFVFGEDWAIAGTYAKYILPLYFIRFIVAPLMFIPAIFEKNQYDFLFQMGLLLLGIGLLGISYVQNLKFKTYLIITSIFVTAYYSLYLLFLNKIKKGLKN